MAKIIEVPDAFIIAVMRKMANEGTLDPKYYQQARKKAISKGNGGVI